MNKPMMSDKEIEIIDKLIEEHQPRVCLEWGSGDSTIYFPSKHSCIASWLSIEEDKQWFDYLKGKTRNNTNVLLLDGDDYINIKGKYDFILIDGRNRMKCLKVAKQIIKEDGFILLHDSGRPEYKFKKYKHQVLCKGELPIKGGYQHRGLTLFK